MMKVFLDTNVVCDFLLGRDPFFEDAVKIMQLAEDGKIEGFISALGMGQVYYLVRKSFSHDLTLIKVKSLIKNLKICSVDAVSIDKALASNFADFEDAIQYFSAMTMPEIEMIVTRDIRDYRHSEIPVFTPKSFNLLYQKNQRAT
mgnify:CR=1 FL=1